MTFLKRRRETLRTTKPTLVLLALVAAVAVVSVGYIIALAILAPQQLAEATTAATDLVCDKCVGTSDIADSAVTSAKIGSGQVKNSDLGPSSVTSAKIADGQVFGSDIAAVTIVSSDIADSAVTSSKLAGGAVKPNVHKVVGSQLLIQPGHADDTTVDCPPGEILTGGGYSAPGMIVFNNYPSDENTWYVAGDNEVNVYAKLQAFALCIGAFP